MQAYNNQLTTLKLNRSQAAALPPAPTSPAYIPPPMRSVQEPVKPKPPIGALNNTLALAIQRDESKTSQDRLRLTPVVNSFIRDAWNGWSESPAT